MTTPARVAVIGGGVAGLAAAARLHDAGCHITLVEAKNRLGGRATSFTDPHTGQRIDNCQHVVLGCCTNLLDLYGRLGVIDQIEWHDRMYFASAAGHIDVLHPSLLPAPLHLSLSMLAFKAYTISEKVALGNAMRAIAAEDRQACTDITFAYWLEQHGQSARLIRRFWDVVVISACNLPCDRVAAEPALQVFQEGFLAHREAWRLGVPRCPLVDLYDPAHCCIDDLRLSTRVRQIEGSHRIESVTLDDGSLLTADAWVLAVPFEHLPGITSDSLTACDDRLSQPRGLGHSPILGVHLHFERAVSDLPHVVLLDASVQWVFFKGGGRTAHAVISAADDWMRLSTEEIVARVRAELAAQFPEVAPGGSNRLLRQHVVKEKRATFAATPGAQGNRPGTRGVIDNLFLAGDYCATGWPATMEGAARSGYAAAGAILGTDCLVADLAPSLLYQIAESMP